VERVADFRSFCGNHSPPVRGAVDVEGDGEMSGIEELAKSLRGECKEIEKRARALMDDPVFRGEQAFLGQHNEMREQIMLAVRHLEDARMRLGKVCQYAGDGVSIFDKA